MTTIHILLVEDNDGDILLTQEALEDARIVTRVSVARDGQEAIDFLNKQENELNHMPDLILLDVNLPKKNGYEVLKYIKANEILKHIPVVMLTTSSSQKDVDIAYSNAASSYIIKPLEADDLVAVVDLIEK